MSDVSDTGSTYNEYFKTFSTISTLLPKLADLLIPGHPERTMIENALKNTAARLAYTGAALHLKYAFTNASLTGEALSIGLNGFPNHSEIEGTMIDLISRDEHQRQLVDSRIHKQVWLDQALKTGGDDSDLLWRIGERRYLDLLDQRYMTLPVVNGELRHHDVAPRDKKHHERRYTFWWSCYSSNDHCPAVYILEFTQDVHEAIDPMHEKGPAFAALLQVIRRVGHRTPSVSLVAHDIDRSLPYIHPKRLTKIMLDRLFTKRLIRLNESPTPEELAANFFFSELAEDGDVVLRFSFDEVQSKKTVGPGIPLLGKKQRYELFDLTSNDERAIERGATYSQGFMLLPHRLAQIAHSEKGERVQALLSTPDRKITYTNGGYVNAI